MGRKDTIWTSSEVSKKYLEGVRGAIPLAKEQIQIIQKIVKKTVPNAKNFLDFGCGDGILGSAILDVFPNSKGTFLDFSPEMIRVVKQKIPGDHIIINRDYGKKNWMEFVKNEETFDVIVSGFSIHHQTDERKKELYEEIFDLLCPGGIFLNLEHVASHSLLGEKLFEEVFVDSMVEFYGDKKTRQELIDDFYNAEDKDANILATVEDQCDWLREIGFSDVDCFLKIFELALFGGVKK
jgi:SAM-dependent methyltransferase